MASQKQIDANRRNAARSTGPKTPEGKATVSRNATRHGLTASRATILPDEDPQEFHDFFESLCAQFQPQTPYERHLVLQMAIADWRLRRSVRLETGLLAFRLDSLRANHGIPRPLPADSAADRKFDRNTLLLGEVFWQECSGFVFPQLLRYENSARRAFYKALSELRLVQSQRRDQTNPIPASAPHQPPAPAPSPTSPPLPAGGPPLRQAPPPDPAGVRPPWGGPPHPRAGALAGWWSGGQPARSLLTAPVSGATLAPGCHPARGAGCSRRRKGQEDASPYRQRFACALAL